MFNVDLLCTRHLARCAGYSVVCIQHLGQCLDHSRCSVNTCWMTDEWPNSPTKEMLLLLFSKWGNRLTEVVTSSRSLGSMGCSQAQNQVCLVAVLFHFVVPAQIWVCSGDNPGDRGGSHTPLLHSWPLLYYIYTKPCNWDLMVLT